MHQAGRHDSLANTGIRSNYKYPFSQPSHPSKPISLTSYEQNHTAFAGGELELLLRLMIPRQIRQTLSFFQYRHRSISHAGHILIKKFFEFQFMSGLFLTQNFKDISGGFSLRLTKHFIIKLQCVFFPFHGNQ